MSHTFLSHMNCYILIQLTPAGQIQPGTFMVYSLWLWNDGKTLSAEILNMVRKVTDWVNALKEYWKYLKHTIILR